MQDKKCKETAISSPTCLKKDVAVPFEQITPRSCLKTFNHRLSSRLPTVINWLSFMSIFRQLQAVQLISVIRATK